MPEVQRHGFDFENWVKSEFFAESDGIYTQKWDVAIEANTLDAMPEEFRNLPVSVKTSKFGSPIGFGDAIRQYTVDEDFLLIVGFWKQSGIFKNFVSAECVRIAAATWRELFSPIDLLVLKKLDELIKNTNLHYSQARLKAQELKKSEPCRSAKMVLNPKIDSKSQRRLQCSLPFNVFWHELAKIEIYQDVDCELFGKKLPNPFESPSRRFKPKLS